MSNPVTERPLSLNAQEVNAVRAGNKTQHRVVIENTIETQILFKGAWRYDGRDFLDNDDCIPHPRGAHYMERLDLSEDEEHQYTEDYRCVGHCPLGAIGDRLWVQEPSLIHCDWCWFYADNTLVECKEPFTAGDLHLPWDDEHQEYIGPIGSEYLPRWASRLLLEITDIRIEQVQDITIGDALKEGLGMNFAFEYWTLKHGYAAWLTNPWVWVIEFKIVEPSESGL